MRHPNLELAEKFDGGRNIIIPNVELVATFVGTKKGIWTPGEDREQRPEVIPLRVLAVRPEQDAFLYSIESYQFCLSSIYKSGLLHCEKIVLDFAGNVRHSDVRAVLQDEDSVKLSYTLRFGDDQ